MNRYHTARREGRLSSFLRGELKLSSGLMNRLKWRGAFLVNGQPAHTNYPVKVGDVICVVLDAPAPDYPAEAGALEILYEDDFLLAVDKPAGMLIHPSRACNTGTLANLVAGYYRQTGQNSAFHPVTRLDRDTYGITLLAKDPQIHTLCNDLHRQGALKKTYHALVFGGPEADAGRIDAPIARKPLPSLLREVRPDGKPSVTVFSVLARYDGYSLLALRPITGRTHQLRLHCAWQGFPILGDPQYGTPESTAFSQTLGLQTQALCAKKLELVHPVTGNLLCLESRMDCPIP